jgi:hypothetical protein
MRNDLSAAVKIIKKKKETILLFWWLLKMRNDLSAAVKIIRKKKKEEREPILLFGDYWWATSNSNVDPHLIIAAHQTQTYLNPFFYSI